MILINTFMNAENDFLDSLFRLRLAKDSWNRKFYFTYGGAEYKFDFVKKEDVLLLTYFGLEKSIEGKWIQYLPAILYESLLEI